MSRVKIALSLVLVLSLLLAIAIPAYAGKGGQGKDKDKDKESPGQQDKSKKDKDKNPKDEQAAVETPEPDEPAEELVTLCHKPGTPAEETLQLPESAVAGHLRHGDVLGACLEVTVSPPPTDTVPITTTATITLCHKPGTPAEKTLHLPESAVPGHLRHGDFLGECPEVTPTPVPTDTSPITSTVTVTICHKPGTPAEKTLLLPETAVPGHMGHGDELGACPEPEDGDDTSTSAAAHPGRPRNRR